MSRRYAARRDENEQEIVQALRAAGWGVCQINHPGFPDLVIAKGKRTLLIEVIGDSKGKKYKRNDGLTPRQVEFHADWPGEIHLVRSVDEALAAIAWED